MEYLVKTPSFCYLQKYQNHGDFRISKRLTLNKSGFSGLEHYLSGNSKSLFIDGVISRGFSLEDVSIRGSFENVSPIHLQLELTHKCNLNCSYCYQDSSSLKPMENMDLGSLYSFLLKEKEKNLLEIGVTGGEATLHPSFLEMMVFLTKEFELIELTSNGTNSDALLEMLESIGENKRKLNLSLSFNHWYRDLNEFVKGNHYLNQTLLKIRKVHNLRLIATDLNYSKKAEERLKQDLSKYGVTELDFSYIIPIGRAEDKVDERESLSRFPYDKSKNKRAFYMVNCGLNFRHNVIDPSGNIRPCTLFPKDFIVGSLIEGFNKEFDYLHFLPAPSPKICGDCDLLNFCVGCVFKGMFNSKDDCFYKEFIAETSNKFN